MSDENIRLHSFRRLTPHRWVNVDHIVAIRQYDEPAQLPQPGLDDGSTDKFCLTISYAAADRSADWLSYDTREERDSVLQELLS